MKQIGESFPYELAQASLGDGISFVIGGTVEDINGRENLTAEQDEALQAVIDAHDPDTPDIATVKESLKSEMYRVLADGFSWRDTNADDWFIVHIDEQMQGFLIRTLLKLNEGRVDPHGGFIRSNGVNVSIDDTGMKELGLFAGVWGDAISAIRIAELEAMDTFTPADWKAYDPYAVDWSITWADQDAVAGWNDNTLTQNP